MNTLKLFQYNKSPDFESKNILLTQKLSGSDKNVKVYSYSNVLYVQSEESRSYLKSNIPLDLSLFISNIDNLYKFFRYIGSENITKLEVISPAGNINVKKSESHDIKKFLHQSNYPIDKAHVISDNKKAVFNLGRREILFEDGFPIKQTIKKLAEIYQ